jgi:hypothetical protein
LETEGAAGIVQLDYLDLPAGDRTLTLLAKAAVIERMPKTEFIEAPQVIELILWRQIHWG